jgi:DNA-binding MarR family transcriptional regulator
MPDLDSMPTLSLSLFIKLRALNSFWNRRIAEFLWQRWKLEVNEALALIVAENDPLTNQAAIGAVLNLHPNAMVGLVRRLHKRRLIAVKAHPHDGRKLTVSLTPRGLEIVRKIRVQPFRDTRLGASCGHRPAAAARGGSDQDPQRRISGEHPGQ